MNEAISVLLIVGAASIGPLEAPPEAETIRDACLFAMVGIDAKDRNIGGKETWFVRDFPDGDGWLRVYCIPAPSGLLTR